MARSRGREGERKERRTGRLLMWAREERSWWPRVLTSSRELPLFEFSFLDFFFSFVLSLALGFVRFFDVRSGAMADGKREHEPEKGFVVRFPVLASTLIVSYNPFKIKIC